MLKFSGGASESRFISLRHRNFTLGAFRSGNAAHTAPPSTNPATPCSWYKAMSRRSASADHKCFFTAVLLPLPSSPFPPSSSAVFWLQLVEDEDDDDDEELLDGPPSVLLEEASAAEAS
jgi:hypothetical protein